MVNTFIAAIAGAPATADYRDWVREQLAERGFSLAADGELSHRDDLVGRYQFHDRDAGRRLLPEAARPLVDQPGPHSGPVAGYFSWTHAVDQRIAEQHLLPAIASISRSVVARTDNGRHKPLVGLVEFPLSNLVGNHGFADGDALLSRSDDYLRYVQREADAALAAAGFSGDVGNFDTHHNPIRLTGALHKQGRVIDDAERALMPHAMTIWAYDPSAFQDLEFWLD